MILQDRHRNRGVATLNHHNIKAGFGTCMIIGDDLSFVCVCVVQLQCYSVTQEESDVPARLPGLLKGKADNITLLLLNVKVVLVCNN